MAAVAAPSYLDFLTFLMSLGPKLPQVIAAIQNVIAAFMALVGIFKPPVPAGVVGAAGPAEHSPTETEIEAEKKLQGMLPEHHNLVGAGGGLGLLAMLRQAYAFIKANPAAWAAIQAIIKNFVPAFGTSWESRN